MNFENVEGTWAKILHDNWMAFNAVCEDMNKHGHDNKVDKYKWREYVLWDMQRRHNDEIKAHE